MSQRQHARRRKHAASSGKRVIVLAKMQDNTPTPERLTKSDFTRGRPRCVLTTVQALFNAGDIGRAELAAADRWYRDYVFSHVGYAEYLGNAQRSELHHDAISWQLCRAHAYGRLLDVRAALGLCSETRLKMMLIDELSFIEIARTLFPRLSRMVARGKVSAQSALVLEQLALFYAEIDKGNKKELAPCMQVLYESSHPTA